jgi:hypothetical protein
VIQASRRPDSIAASRVCSPYLAVNLHFSPLTGRAQRRLGLDPGLLPSAPPRYCISHGGLLTRMVLDSLSSHFPNQCPMWRTQNSGRLKMLSMGLSLPSALPLVSKSPGPLPHTSSTPSCDPNVHVFAGISLPAFCP